MNINEMNKRIQDIKGMGLGIGDPKHGDFVLYAKVYEKLPEFIGKMIRHNIPFMVEPQWKDNNYRKIWVKEEHAHKLYSVSYGMTVDD